MDGIRKMVCLALVAVMVIPVILIPAGVMVETSGDNNGLNSYLKNINYDPDKDIVMHSGCTQLPYTYNGDDTQTVTVKYVLQTAKTDGFGTLANSSRISSIAYPGAILEGNSDLADNNPTRVLSPDRSNVTLNIDLPGLSSNVFDVNPTNYGDVKNAIDSKCKEWSQSGSTKEVNMTYTYTKAESEKQLEVELNVTAEKLANLNISSDYVSKGTETKYVVKYSCIYYGVSVSLKNQPGDYFGPQTTVKDINTFIKDHQQGVIVSYVAYGCEVLMSVTSNESSDDVNSAISAAICGTTESLSNEYKEIVNNCKIDVWVNGGPSGVPVPKNSINEVKKYVNNCIPTPESITNSVPLQYVTSFIDTGATAHCQSTAEYNEKIVTITQEIEFSYDFSGAFASHNKLVYYTFDKIDENGNYVNERQVELKSGTIYAGNSSVQTITAKHEPRFTLYVTGDGCDDIIGNGVSLYPLESIYYDHGGTTCDQSITVKVDGVTVYDI